MAFSADSSDHDTEADEEKQTSRFVVDADQLREGEFKTLKDLSEAIEKDNE